jgi:hypothetical protein
VAIQCHRNIVGVYALARPWLSLLAGGFMSELWSPIGSDAIRREPGMEGLKWMSVWR